jgi:hypothetical protein
MTGLHSRSATFLANDRRETAVLMWIKESTGVGA